MQLGTFPSGLRSLAIRHPVADLGLICLYSLKDSSLSGLNIIRLVSGMENLSQTTNISTHLITKTRRASESGIPCLFN